MKFSWISTDDKNERYAGASHPLPPKATDLPVLTKKKISNMSYEEKRQFGRDIVLLFYNKRNGPE